MMAKQELFVLINLSNDFLYCKVNCPEMAPIHCEAGIECDSLAEMGTR